MTSSKIKFNVDKKPILILFGVLITVILTVSCGLDLSGNEPQGTLDAMSTSIVMTATAASASDNSENSQAITTARAEATQRSASHSARMGEQMPVGIRRKFDVHVCACPTATGDPGA